MKRTVLAIVVTIAVAAILAVSAVARADAPTTRGFTVEVAGGGGLVVPSGNDASPSFFSGALGIGVGGFLADQLAVTLRVSTAVPVGDGLTFGGVVGPHAQYWPTKSAWLGAGGGLGFFAGCATACFASATGAAVDVRAGVAVYSSRHGAVSVSLEGDLMFGAGTIVSLLVGYQAF